MREIAAAGEVTNEGTASPGCSVANGIEKLRKAQLQRSDEAIDRRIAWGIDADFAFGYAS